MKSPVFLPNPVLLTSTGRGDGCRPFRAASALVLVAAVFLVAGARDAWAQEIPSPEEDISRTASTALGASSDDGTPLPPAGYGPPSPALRHLDNLGYGPLRLASQSPFQSLRLSLPADAPSVLAGGHWEFRESTAFSKMWGQSDDYLLDYEILSTIHSFVYGMTDDTQFELGAVDTIRVGGTLGGSLDGFIRHFHDAFGLNQGGRNQYPRGAFLFHLKGRDGRTIVIPEDGTSASTQYLLASVHQTLLEGNDYLPAIASTWSLKTSLEKSPDIAGEGVEVAWTMMAAKRVGDVYAYLNVGFTRFGDEQFHGLPMRSVGSTLIAAVEWNFMADVSVVVQMLRTQGALVNYGPFALASNEVSLGFKIEASRGAVVEFGVIENIIVFDNTPDFGVQFGLTVRF
jgi:hypothetical protein